MIALWNSNTLQIRTDPEEEKEVHGFDGNHIRMHSVNVQALQIEDAVDTDESAQSDHDQEDDDLKEEDMDSDEHVLFGLGATPGGPVGVSVDLRSNGDWNGNDTEYDSGYRMNRKSNAIYSFCKLFYDEEIRFLYTDLKQFNAQVALVTSKMSQI